MDTADCCCQNYTRRLPGSVRVAPTAVGFLWSRQSAALRENKRTNVLRVCVLTTRAARSSAGFSAGKDQWGASSHRLHQEPLSCRTNSARALVHNQVANGRQGARHLDSAVRRSVGRSVGPQALVGRFGKRRQLCVPSGSSQRKACLLHRPSVCGPRRPVRGPLFCLRPLTEQGSPARRLGEFCAPHCSVALRMRDPWRSRAYKPAAAKILCSERSAERALCGAPNAALLGSMAARRAGGQAGKLTRHPRQDPLQFAAVAASSLRPLHLQRPRRETCS